MHNKKKAFMAVVPGLLALTLNACSSGGSGSDTNTKSTAKGTPIRVMTTAAFTGLNSPYPDVRDAQKAAVKSINASGGIKGHPIALTVCDDTGDPNVAQSCAQQAVSGKFSAVMGTINVNSPSILPTLEKAGIPFIGNYVQTPLDATSPVSFPIGTGGLGLARAGGLIAKEEGCKSSSALIIQAANLTASFQSDIKAGLKLNNVPFKGDVIVPGSQSNYSSTVATLRSKGASCVISLMAEQMTSGFLSALKQSGQKLTIITAGGSLGPISEVAGIAEGVYAFSPFRAPTDPKAKPVVDKLKTFAPDIDVTSAALDGWAGVKLLADGLRKVADEKYTPAAVLKGMNSLENAKADDIIPPYTTTKPNPNPGQARIFNNKFVTYKVTGDTTETVHDFQVLPGFESK